jgi:hypothetical protein
MLQKLRIRKVKKDKKILKETVSHRKHFNFKSGKLEKYVFGVSAYTSTTTTKSLFAVMT